MKKRHLFFWGLLRPLVSLFLKLKFGYKFKTPKALPPQYIVLSNHVTDWDPLFVAVALKRQMYFVGSEHIARWKRAYNLLKYVFAPIMRPKGASAMAAVMSILRHVKKGANVCLFPEGVRSWDGKPCPILPSTAKLVQKAGVGLVTFRITGGYFVSPMWSNGLRRGNISGAPVGVYTAEELKNMSEEEIFEIILRDLGEDAYKTQKKAPHPYKNKALAENLEHFLFYCPACGEKGGLHSAGNALSCAACGHRWIFDEYGYLTDETGRQSVSELADAQTALIAEDVAKGAVLSIEGATVSTVTDHKEKVLSRGRLTMDGEYIRCGEVSVPMADITEFAMHGKFALVFSAGRDYYEILPDEKQNMIKFLLYYNEYSKVKVG